MRMSHLFSQTLREAPAGAETTSHQLLVRAGYIGQLAAGVFSYLPLAFRSLNKIKNIMRDEMDAIGGQEMNMPVVNPASLWQETNRWYEIDSEMGRFVDRTGRDMVLALSHEEVVTDLLRRIVQSYRQLPALIYHIQTKWRDDPRPRAGLIRAREFTMLDSYSLDPDDEHLDQQYRAHYQAYYNIFARCDLPVIAVQADVGMMGGTMAHEYMYLTPIGEDTLLLCGECGYRANRQIATFRKPAGDDSTPLPMEKVETPNCKTIAELANFLNVPTSKTAKAVFLMATIAEGEEDVEKFVFAVVRGDMELSETKLSNSLKAKGLRPATETEIIAVGATPGYASPVGIDGTLVVVDEAVTTSPNLVAGANDAGYHLLNVNFGRDYKATVVTDITSAQEGDACPECGTALGTSRGVEVANIFKLGTRYSDKLGATFAGAKGQAPVIMGSYGIGVGRLLACIAEHHHDDYGLMWPITVAPFQVHLVGLKGGFEEADALYAQLKAEGIEVLYDDRNDSPGVKFNDADLIGIPIRVTLGKRSLKQGGAEFKLRHERDRTTVALDELVPHIKAQIKALTEAVQGKVTPVEFGS